MWCSAFDLDVSERVVFEENTITLVDAGNIPHGNSLSQYDYVHHPWSRGWLVARNTFTRPPCRGAVGSGGQCGGDPSLGLDNWLQRETLTTDGSGAWAVGYLAAAAGATVQLRWTAWTNAPVPGTRLLIVDGPGLGQSRTVVGTPANGTLVLDDPLDGHATVNASLVVVLTDASDKAIVGNSFSWSNVIQAYGSTYRYVNADNTISNGNFRQHHAGATGGVLGAAGECYHRDRHSLLHGVPEQQAHRLERVELAGRRQCRLPDVRRLRRPVDPVVRDSWQFTERHLAGGDQHDGARRDAALRPGQRRQHADGPVARDDRYRHRAPAVHVLERVYAGDDRPREQLRALRGAVR